jgi:hypothetical protein
MKKILLSIYMLSAITIPALCQADTIDYWRVFLDNKLIKEFSWITDNPSIELKISEISKNSILTINYFRDTYCKKCKEFLVVCNSEDEQIFKIRRSSSICTLNLKRLIKISSRRNESSFKINLRKIPDLEETLFTLTLIK